MLAGFFASVGNILTLRLFGHTRLVLQRFLPVTKMSSPLVMVGPRSLEKQARGSFAVIAVLSVRNRFFECACCCIASDT
ncbi:hypothetical protein X727_32800 [Mesorhizobium sp. L103C119B0]|nr:hypothetical protein X727_32800 [Mesorhizobium sp. L103C119B0]